MTKDDDTLVWVLDKTLTYETMPECAKKFIDKMYTDLLILLSPNQLQQARNSFIEGVRQEFDHRYVTIEIINL